MDATTPEPDPIDPEFAARLEWQVRTALRRTTRFARPARGAWRVAKLAALVVVALSAGASATLAIQRVQESKAAQLRVQIVALELLRAEHRQKRCSDTLARLDAAIERGLAPRSARTEAELAAARSTSELRRRQLDVDEIAASGRTPDNSLAAPSIGGRDFTGARIALEVEDAVVALAAAKRECDFARRLVGSAAASGEKLADAQIAVARRESELQRGHARADLRARFLSGELSAARVEWLGRIADNDVARARLSTELSNVQSRVEHLRALHAAGVVPDGEVAAAEAALADAQAELQILQDERALLDAELASAR